MAGAAAADDHTVRTLLALRRVCGRAQPPRTDLHTAVELRDRSRLEDLIMSVGEARAKHDLQVVKSDQLMERIVVQSSRQSGVSHVYWRRLRLP